MSSNGNAERPWIAEHIGPYADASVSLEDRRAGYREMIGHVPPRVDARLQVTGAIDPVALQLQEQFRTHAMTPDCFDEKTVQLLIFAMMMIELSDAAKLHATAARRAGASWEELQAVVTLCSVFRGVPAANRGAEILATVAEKEWASKGGA